MLKEFREFALRGRVLDMSVGIIIGAAFTSIVNSLVDDILMPPLGWLLGGINLENFYLTLNNGSTGGPFASLADAQAAGGGDDQSRSVHQRGHLLPAGRPGYVLPDPGHQPPPDCTIRR